MGPVQSHRSRHHLPEPRRLYVLLCAGRGRLMYVTVHLELTEEQHYFTSCARIRGISHKRLARRILAAACEDQMIGGILDDDARRQRQLTGESIRSHFKKQRITPEP